MMSWISAEELPPSLALAAVEAFEGLEDLPHPRLNELATDLQHLEDQRKKLHSLLYRY